MRPPKQVCACRNACMSMCQHATCATDVYTYVLRVAACCSVLQYAYILAFNVRTCIFTHAHTISLSLSLFCIYTYMYTIFLKHTHSLSAIHTHTHTHTLSRQDVDEEWLGSSVWSVLHAHGFSIARYIFHTHSHMISHSPYLYFVPPLLSTLYLSISLSLSLSISLSLTLSISHTLYLSRSLSLTLSISLCRACAHALFVFLFLPLSPSKPMYMYHLFLSSPSPPSLPLLSPPFPPVPLSRSLALSPFHPPFSLCLSISLSVSLSLSLSLNFFLSFTCTHTLSHSRTHTDTLAQRDVDEQWLGNGVGFLLQLCRDSNSTKLLFFDEPLTYIKTIQFTDRYISTASLGYCVFVCYFNSQLCFTQLLNRL